MKKNKPKHILAENYQRFFGKLNEKQNLNEAPLPEDWESEMEDYIEQTVSQGVESLFSELLKNIRDKYEIGAEGNEGWGTYVSELIGEMLSLYNEDDKLSMAQAYIIGALSDEFENM